MDSFLAIAEGLINLILTWYSVHIFLEQGRKKVAVMVLGIGMLGIVLIGISAHRASQSQALVEEQLDAIQKNTEKIPERPWIVVTHAGISLHNRLDLSGFVVHVKNTSGVPAKVRIELLGSKNESLDRDIVITAKDVTEKASNEQLVDPHAEADLMDFSLLRAMGSGIALRLLGGYAQGLFRLDGGMIYTDPNGHRGFTRFCLILVNGESVGRCLVDNDMQ